MSIDLQIPERTKLFREIIWIFLLSTAFAWLWVVFNPEGAAMVLFSIGCGSVALISWVCFQMLAKGALKASALLYVSWILVLQVSSIVSEGVQAQMVVSFINLIFIAGFVLGAHYAVWVTGFVAPIVIGAKLLEHLEVLPLFELQSPPMATASLITSFVGTGFLAFVTIRFQERAYEVKVKAETDSILRLERAKALTGLSRDIGQLTSESSMIRKAVDATHSQAQNALIVFLQDRNEEIAVRCWKGESLEGLDLTGLHRQSVSKKSEEIVFHEVKVSDGVLKGDWGGLSINIHGDGDYSFGVLLYLERSESFQREAVVPLLGTVGAILRSDLMRRWTEASSAQIRRLEAVGRLAGGVAHDFNNHLATIVGSAEALEANLEESSKSLESAKPELKRISEASSDASRLVQKLLAFSKGDPEESQPLEIVEYLRVFQSKGGIARSGGISVDFDVPEAPVWVEMNETSLGQVLQNLIENAVAASQPGGWVRVSLREDRSLEYPEAVIVVADNGKGMEDSVKERAFEPFYSSGNPKGHGLGLSIVHGCVTGMEGRIHIDSESGVGTQISIRFPIISTEVPSRRNVPPVNSGKELSLKGVRVLVVDDEENVRSTICSMLETLGAEVLGEFSNGKMALDWMGETGEVDVVLTDLTMPVMDGVTLVRKVRSSNPELPIVVMTGYAQGREAVLDSLGVCRVSKPLRMRDLVQSIDNALTSRPSKTRLQREENEC